MPRRKSARLAFKGKGKGRIGEGHEHGSALDAISIQSDDSDNEARILENLLIHREGQIDALENDLHRERNFNQFLQIQNRQMSVHMVVYETRAIKYKNEAAKAQARIEELIGDFDEDEEEDQPRRKRPRTIGLRRALEKQREEEQALFQSTPLIALLEQEIESNKEA